MYHADEQSFRILSVPIASVPGIFRKQLAYFFVWYIVAHEIDNTCQQFNCLSLKIISVTIIYVYVKREKEQREERQEKQFWYWHAIV